MPSVGPRKEGQYVQSVRFDKKRWSQAQASKWLAQHGYRNYGVDETQNQLRYRQYDPEPQTMYRYNTSIKLPAGIRFIVPVGRE